MVEATIKDGLPSLSFVVARTKIQLISAFNLGGESNRIKIINSHLNQRGKNSTS